MRYFFSSHPRPIGLSARTAIAIILGVTLWRIVMLAFNQTDLSSMRRNTGSGDSIPTSVITRSRR